MVDEFFRQFNGHTQVNAGDLRSLGYPDREALEMLGTQTSASGLDQHALDALIEEELLGMADNDQGAIDPVRAKRRVDEALDILVALGFPKEQQQARSALTLLAILDVRPDSSWSQARERSIGIIPMMNFFRDHYGKTYAPNSRETVRRFTVHQFDQAGMIVRNAGKALQPNSPAYSYQIEPAALELVRTYGTQAWPEKLAQYRTMQPSLAERYAAVREFQRIPLTLPDGEQLTISPGGQNLLIEKVVHYFCPRFTPGGHLMYLGDADQKWVVNKRDELAALGINVEEHGKMPDLIVHLPEKNWLVLIEAVVSHGPVDAKRHQELKDLFAGSSAGLVCVTAFESRAKMAKYLRSIAWATEVWAADAPSHLIHFNGERFLGPY